MPAKSMLFVPVASLFFLLPWWGFGQQKYEKEYRAEEADVPAEAVEFIKPMQFETKVKWYYEENLAGNSFEAKFKDGKDKYSVEFDTLGNLQDIELERRFQDLAPELKEEVTAHLQIVYAKFRIRKVQLQYSGNIPNLYSFLASAQPETDYTLRYEIVVKGKQDEGWNLYEITFDDSGEPLQTAEIVLRNTDNLEY